MTVYRVENNQHIGPYKASIIADYDSGKMHPVPWQDHKLSRYIPDMDTMISDYHDYVCAFASLFQLMTWFTQDDLATMSSAGFIVQLYSVPTDTILIGTKQVLIHNRYLIASKVSAGAKESIHG